MIPIGLILERLRPRYGARRWQPDLPPVDTLVLTMLTQHTSDVNSDRAFASLRQAFPTWEAVCDAPTPAVAAAIRSAGLANTKAPRIQAALAEIAARRSRLDLDFLADLSLAEAKAWLATLAGVGPKTVACVLLFGLGRPALPVDTHVHRIATRLGLLPPGTSAEQAHELLEKLVPPEDVYEFHVNLIAHGRTLCHARRPDCEVCPLGDLCPMNGQLTESSELSAGQALFRTAAPASGRSQQ